MSEENLSDISTSAVEAEEIIERGRQRLSFIERDLKNFNTQYELMSEECSLTKKRISDCEKYMRDIHDDVRVLNDLKHKLKYNAKTKHTKCSSKIETFSELDVLIEKKRENYINLSISQQQLEATVKRTHVHLNSLQQRLEVRIKDLKNEENYLLNYEKWIYVLTNRRMHLSYQISEMEEDLKATILGSNDVSDPAIWELKMKVDFKQLNMDRKFMLYSDTLDTLENTKEQYDLTTEEIKSIKNRIKILETLVSDKIFELEKVVLFTDLVQTVCEKIECHLNKFIEMQKNYNRAEKLRATEHQLFMHSKELRENERILNNCTSKLNAQTLKLSAIEANKIRCLTKRDEVEAQIAFEIYGH